MIDYIGTKMIQTGILIALLIFSPVIIYAWIKEEIEFRKTH